MARVVLRFGTPVACPDGWLGRVWGIEVTEEDGARRATALLVRRGFLLFQRDLSVPLSEVARWAEEALFLHSPQEAFLSRPAPSLDTSALTAGAPARLRGGGQAPIKGVVLEEGMALTSLLLKVGEEVVIAPAGALSSLGRRGPLLDLPPEEAKNLPLYRPDPHILRDIQDLLLTSPALQGADLSALEVKVREGEVLLRGTVRLPTWKEEVERAVRSVRGVLRVESHITSDPEIELAVAQRLAGDSRTRGGRVFVRSYLGRVHLEGEVPSPQAQEAAVALARGVAGVREVVSNLHVGTALEAPKG